MSLSEEGSLVFCIVAKAGNRSTFFEAAGEEKANKRLDAHLSQAFSRDMEASFLAPRLPQRCFVSPIWGLPVTRHG
jgi:hypothetical protein